MDIKDEKKKIELEALRVFLENDGMVFDKSKVKPDTLEPADVSYDGRLFQIKTAPFELRGAYEKVNKRKKDREEYRDVKMVSTLVSDAIFV